ncbi:MAG: hypothetical protein NTY47_01345, partial [Candidatus Omnitrophica bacterium]|nr:hypothetical protein [Candidatus Omnitrophota bacterium]
SQIIPDTGVIESLMPYIGKGLGMLKYSLPVIGLGVAFKTMRGRRVPRKTGLIIGSVAFAIVSALGLWIMLDKGDHNSGATSDVAIVIHHEAVDYVQPMLADNSPAGQLKALIGYSMPGDTSAFGRFKAILNNMAGRNFFGRLPENTRNIFSAAEQAKMQNMDLIGLAKAIGVKMPQLDAATQTEVAKAISSAYWELIKDKTHFSLASAGNLRGLIEYGPEVGATQCHSRSVILAYLLGLSKIGAGIAGVDIGPDGQYSNDLAHIATLIKFADGTAAFVDTSFKHTFLQHKVIVARSANGVIYLEPQYNESGFVTGFKRLDSGEVLRVDQVRALDNRFNVALAAYWSGEQAAKFGGYRTAVNSFVESLYVSAENGAAWYRLARAMQDLVKEEGAPAAQAYWNEVRKQNAYMTSKLGLRDLSLEQAKDYSFGEAKVLYTNDGNKEGLEHIAANTNDLALASLHAYVPLTILALMAVVVMGVSPAVIYAGVAVDAAYLGYKFIQQARMNVGAAVRTILSVVSIGAVWALACGFSGTFTLGGALAALAIVAGAVLVIGHFGHFGHFGPSDRYITSANMRRAQEWTVAEYENTHISHGFGLMANVLKHLEEDRKIPGVAYRQAQTGRIIWNISPSEISSIIRGSQEREFRNKAAAVLVLQIAVNLSQEDPLVITLVLGRPRS